MTLLLFAPKLKLLSPNYVFLFPQASSSAPSPCAENKQSRVSLASSPFGRDRYSVRNEWNHSTEFMEVFQSQLTHKQQNKEQVELRFAIVLISWDKI